MANEVRIVRNMIAIFAINILFFNMLQTIVLRNCVRSVILKNEAKLEIYLFGACA